MIFISAALQIDCHYFTNATSAREDDAGPPLATFSPVNPGPLLSATSCDLASCAQSEVQCCSSSWQGTTARLDYAFHFCWNLDLSHAAQSKFLCPRESQSISMQHLDRVSQIVIIISRPAGLTRVSRKYLQSMIVLSLGTETLLLQCNNICPKSPRRYKTKDSNEVH
jgi:hypothetical protein